MKLHIHARLAVSLLSMLIATTASTADLTDTDANGHPSLFDVVLMGGA